MMAVRPSAPRRVALALALVSALAACKEDTAATRPDPAPITAQTLAHFCQMSVAEHGGPKGQVHLKGHPAPLFFAQVRDLVAYLKSPEREAEITAIYVTDTGGLQDWNAPNDGPWVLAPQAHFVINSGVAGGMGAPEIVPFADPTRAGDFVRRNGGTVVSLDAIPDAAALAPVDLDQPLKEPLL